MWICGVWAIYCARDAYIVVGCRYTKGVEYGLYTVPGMFTLWLVVGTPRVWICGVWAVYCARDAYIVVGCRYTKGVEYGLYTVPGMFTLWLVVGTPRVWICGVWAVYWERCYWGNHCFLARQHSTR